MDKATFIDNYLYRVRFYDFFFPKVYILNPLSPKNMQVEYISFQTH